MTTPASGQLLAGKFHLERHLARGGMGEVWIAHDVTLRRAVAVKFMYARHASSAELRARFDREARAAAQLSTPHVVQIFDHGIDGDTPFIVMELLDGEDLGAKLHREGRLDLGEATRLAAQVAKALRRAHEAGIIHRDLTPRNVFLARGDDEIVYKVLDFGVAKAPRDQGDETTHTGELLGTPKYMSPEQARGLRTVDHRSDLWSLGVILFYAITGRAPFEGESAGDLVFRICSDPLPSARALAPELPPAVDAFFARALARSPDDRFQSAPELARAFDEAIRSAGGPREANDEGKVPAFAAPRRAALVALGLVALVAAGAVLLMRSAPQAASLPAEAPPPSASLPSASLPSASLPSTSVPAPSVWPDSEPSAPSARATARPPVKAPAPRPQATRPVWGY